MLTSANATNRFLDLTFEKLFLKVTQLSHTLALFSDTVFLSAVLF